MWRIGAHAALEAFLCLCPCGGPLLSSRIDLEHLPWLGPPLSGTSVVLFTIFCPDLHFLTICSLLDPPLGIGDHTVSGSSAVGIGDHIVPQCAPP